MSKFPKGSKVRVKTPEDHIAEVRRKVTDRVGEVTGHQFPTPNPIVKFAKEGRRKEFTKAFYDRDLELAE